jgi:hypothetical protein
VAVTVNLNRVPTVAVEEAALVITGFEVAAVTVSVNGWMDGLPMPLDAVIVIGYLPRVPSLAVPFRLAVPFPLSVKVTPAGSAPFSVIAGVGAPVVVTVKEKGDRILVEADAGLVMAGACSSTLLAYSNWLLLSKATAVQYAAPVQLTDSMAPLEGVASVAGPQVPSDSTA